MSKKYQPKKKEEDENKYVWFISFVSWLILDLFGLKPSCLNQHLTLLNQLMDSDIFMFVSHTDDVPSRPVLGTHGVVRFIRR